MKRLLVFLLSITMFLAFSSVSALALPTATSYFSGTGEINFFEDDDVEWLEHDGDNDGTLDVGDTLKGLYRIQAFNGVNVAEGGDTSTGLSGLFEIEVFSKTDNGDGTFDFEFGPKTDGSGNFQATADLSAGAMINLYETNTPLPDFDDDPGPIRSKSELVDDVTDGTLLYEFGFTNTGDPEFWSALDATDNPGSGANVSQSTTIGTFNTGLSLVTNNFLPLGPKQKLTDGQGNTLGLYDLLGSGSFKGTLEIDTSASISSDADFQYSTVPEPTTLLLFGTGLLGLAAFGRKKFMGKK